VLDKIWKLFYNTFRTFF